MFKRFAAYALAAFLALGVCHTTTNAQNTDPSLTTSAVSDLTAAVSNTRWGGDNIQIMFGDADDALISFNAADLVVGFGGSTVYGMKVDLGIGSGPQFIVQNLTATTQFIVTPTNDTNAGFSFVEILVPAVYPTNGSDIVNMLELDWNETDWATATETLNGLYIDGITQDAQGRYNAISIGTGWDSGIEFVANQPALSAGGTTLVQFLASGVGGRMTLPAAAAQNDIMFEIAPAALTAMNGSDVQQMLVIDVPDAVHSGGANSNDLTGLQIDVLGTADANVIERAINIEAGWDYGLSIVDDGSATLSNITLGDSLTADAQIYFNGTALVMDMDGGSNDFEVTLTGDAYSHFRAGDASRYFQFFPANIAGTNSTLARFTWASSAVLNGSDTLDVIGITFVNADHTGTGNTVNLISTAALSGDAESNLNAIYIGALTGTTGSDGEFEYAINIQAGWDAAFYHVGIAHANLVATDNGSFVFCTNCDPASTPCTTGGASTGAFAFRVAGAWDCPW